MTDTEGSWDTPIIEADSFGEFDQELEKLVEWFRDRAVEIQDMSQEEYFAKLKIEQRWQFKSRGSVERLECLMLPYLETRDDGKTFYCDANGEHYQSWDQASMWLADYVNTLADVASGLTYGVYGLLLR